VGDEAGLEAFDDVFGSIYPHARNVALRILGTVADAEDAAAEALARALADWSRIGCLPHRDAWILRVTTNVAIDIARRRLPSSLAAEPYDTSDDLAVLRVTLVSALLALPRRQREALVLRHMAGFSEVDVAAALGVSHNTVKKHLQRGMSRLRTTFTTEERASLAFD
jgi:RNA polymerase sigma factor (sigma-70 family)